MAKLTIKDMSFTGKRVLMRVDFNVPLHNGQVADDTRIRAALPSISHVVKNGGRLVLMSHLGRPKGKRVPEMSLRPCVSVLEDLLGQPVQFVEDCIGGVVEAAADKLAPGQVLLMENLRYHAEETDNEPGFAENLAKLGDIYINDAFGTAHRAHASTEGVTHYIDQNAAGFLLMKELEYLGRVVSDPKHPFVAILGGAKISGKIDVISNLLPQVDHLIIGGGMAYTFYRADGREIGNSLLEADKIDMARDLLRQAGEKIILPEDCVVSDAFDLKARTVGNLRTVAQDAIPKGFWGLDIGPRSVAAFKSILETAKTVVWNGPMGVFEIESTAQGTYAIARILADISVKGATTVIGGGDSASAAQKSGVTDKISHISTGGGASLEFLEGKELPGVAALTEKTERT